jgi:hypothetical protein
LPFNGSCKLQKSQRPVFKGGQDRNLEPSHYLPRRHL